jgi:hypothetical protein
MLLFFLSDKINPGTGGRREPWVSPFIYAYRTVLKKLFLIAHSLHLPKPL